MEAVCAKPFEGKLAVTQLFAPTPVRRPARCPPYTAGPCPMTSLRKDPRFNMCYLSFSESDMATAPFGLAAATLQPFQYQAACCP